MNRYRIELFNRTGMTFASMAECDEPDINIDYLVSVQSKVTCPKEVVANNGDFAQIRINGKVYFQGIVVDANFDGKRTEITLNQMTEVLNTEAFADVELLKTQSIEEWLSNILTQLFRGNDTAENLPNFLIVRQSSTSGTHTASDKGIYNVYDLAVSFFKVYGVMLDFEFDYMTKTVVCTMHGVSDTSYNYDLSVSDVLEYEIQSSLSSDSPNKMIIKDEDNAANVITYYWHPTEFSGTIDTDATTNRVVPVKTRCETVTVGEDETFEDVAYASAENTLYSSRYDDLITVTVRADSALFSDWHVGQLFTLHANGKEYNTLLTGIHKDSMSSIQLTFGYVRKRLTQILKMKGRG